MGREKPALSLATYQYILCGPVIDGLAYGVLADLKAGCQLMLTGYGLARSPLPLIETLQEQGFDLLVERTISRAQRIRALRKPTRLSRRIMCFGHGRTTESS